MSVPPAGGSGEFERWINLLAQLPPEHFKLALKTVEAQLARNHELQMEQERCHVREAADSRSHALLAWGLGAGFVVVLGMITASVVVGLQGHVWLSASLSGPGVAVLASLFVLRSLDSRNIRQIRPPQLPAPPPDQTLQ
ncbi:hypothetical protein ACFYP7_31335 [Micromonospora arida]|uniref:hypothetical protein n=1 Tax=Micromonospora arida TaxID=2203715 RepID=UPI003691CF12